MMRTNLFVIANAKQLRTGGSFRILLPFFSNILGFWFPKFSNFLRIFKIGLSLARFWRAFGISGRGVLNPPNHPRYATDRLSWSSRFCIQTAASKMTDRNFYRVSTLVLHTCLFTQPHKQKSNRLMSGDSNTPVSVTIQNQIRVHTHPVVTMTVTVTFQI